MRLLELFSGTKSVGKVAEQYGYEVVSLDLKNADINCNILEWDYKAYEPGYFKVIWASPPCTEYSTAKTTGTRKIDEANKIVMKTLEIIEYLNPQYWIIENPQTGLLKKQVFMYGLPYVDVDYCKYGMPYRKRTRLWNNISSWKPRGLCKTDCNSMVGNRHMCIAQHAKASSDKTGPQQKFKQSELYVIPTELITELLNVIERT